MEFKQGNRSSAYVTGLRFQPDRGAADPDRAHQTCDGAGSDGVVSDRGRLVRGGPRTLGPKRG
jgi:hypothetical protein